MAWKTHFNILVPALIFCIVLAIAGPVAPTRKIPKSPKNDDVKHPEFLVAMEPQPTVLVPGLGRYLLPPKCKKPFMPVNPVTGEPISGGSIGGQTPVRGGGVGGSRQIPGGDDTLVPNPGYGVPPPGTGAGVPPVPQP